MRGLNASAAGGGGGEGAVTVRRGARDREVELMQMFRSVASIRASSSVSNASNGRLFTSVKLASMVGMPRR